MAAYRMHNSRISRESTRKMTGYRKMLLIQALEVSARFARM